MASGRPGKWAYVEGGAYPELGRARFFFGVTSFSLSSVFLLLVFFVTLTCVDAAGADDVEGLNLDDLRIGEVSPLTVGSVDLNMKSLIWRRPLKVAG